MRRDIVALSMEPGDGAVKLGAPVQLHLFAKSKAGRAELVPGNMAAWSSSDDAVAEVSRQGRLTPRGRGAVTISATYAERTIAALFTVVD
jgi:hypothetical protein